MSALALLAGTVLALAALLIVVMSVPLRLSLRFASEPRVVDLSVGWPIGWLPDIRLGGKAKSGAKTPALPRRSRPTRRRALHETRLPRALKALPRLLVSVLRSLRVEQLRLHGRFGAGDPAVTGQIYGACTPFVFGTAGMQRVDLRLEPDFSQACLSADGVAVLRVRPIALAGPALRFLWACYGPRG